MSKLLVAALAVAALVGGGVLLQPKLKEMSLDSDAKKLVGTCYLTSDQMLYFGLTKYNEEENTFDMEGAVGGMLPVAGKIKRDGFLDALSKGEVAKERCPSQMQQQEE